LNAPTKTPRAVTTGAVTTAPMAWHHCAMPVDESYARTTPSSPPTNSKPSVAAAAVSGTPTSTRQPTFVEGDVVSFDAGQGSLVPRSAVRTWRTAPTATRSTTTPTPQKARPDRRVSNHAPPGPSGNTIQPERHLSPSTIILGLFPPIIIERRVLGSPLGTGAKGIRHDAAISERTHGNRHWDRRGLNALTFGLPPLTGSVRFTSEGRTSHIQTSRNSERIALSDPLAFVSRRVNRAASRP